MNTEHDSDQKSLFILPMEDEYGQRGLETLGRGPVPVALTSLPRAPEGFTGRNDELAALLAALAPQEQTVGETSAAPGAAVVISAVSGLGGIGKTALALQAAHQVNAKRWFPGGTLFIDLRGYGDDAVTAQQAACALLKALGVGDADLPVTSDAQYALLRSLMARQPGPMLLVLDNASDAAQVVPLLPGDPRHRVLVTSRIRLSQLGARLLSLDILSPDEARTLLKTALCTAHPNDHRVHDDPEAADRLAVLCGCLPLALQIAAALLSIDPDKPITELVSELEAEQVQLDDGERSVRSALDLSYRRLPVGEARLLRLLSIAPGPDIGVDAVIALVGTESSPTRSLRNLVHAHLIEPAKTRSRWRLHDLVRTYSAALARQDEEETAAAGERIVAHYGGLAGEASQRLRWLPGELEPTRFVSRNEALTWLDTERENLVATVQWAYHHQQAHRAAQLALDLAPYLEWRRYLDDARVVSRIAQQAAQDLGDRELEASAWNNLGVALREAGRVQEAIDAHTRARDLLVTIGDRELEASAWNNLGVALREAGRVQEAIDAHTRARDLLVTIGDRELEASAWNNLGVALREAGRVQEAIDAHTQARDLHLTTGNRREEGRAWNNMGIVLHMTGRQAQAGAAFGTALRIFQEFEDHYEIGNALHNLAVTHRELGETTTARIYWTRAAEAFSRAGAFAEATQALELAEGRD
ncbi:tetratricopeptide repeat protein [Streptomyces sp. NBC_01288]|uniref:tetratricopeptide repeat protein n=1 Tax=Streptomyces sp. NBC_01288 TaxID=2903814 RepID=UPI002E0F9DF8|nr:tetratricopeptide repeat protein [Streptomyces sp. NBC_01288]